MLKELGYTLKKTEIASDNQGAIFISSNPVTEKRSKHIDIRFHYIRERITEGDIEVLHVPGTENPADILTKNLGFVKFSKFVPMLGLNFR